MDWKNYFTYDPSSGELTRNALPREHFASDRAHGRCNKMYAGKVAGYKVYRREGQRAAIQVSLFSKEFQAHIIAWEMTHGPIPEGFVIDHIDRNPFNNRIQNLRLATISQNAMNASKHKPNRSGVKGVSMEYGKYRAVIRKNYKAISLGTFATLEEAAEARRIGEIQFHGNFAPQ